MSHQPPALQTSWQRLRLHADWLAIRIKERLNWLDQVDILAYRGHGTPTALYLRGRVLEQKGITTATQTDPAWRNLLNMYRRFSSSAIPNARVRARFGDQELEACTDAHGFFHLTLVPEQPLAQQRVWHAISLEVLEPRFERQRTICTTGHVLVPPPGARFGVISDIDDTIVRTEATHLLRMLRLVLFSNAYTRLPFKGVAAFYRALQRGASGEEYNPIFYVSSSPWNIYDLLIDFLNIHGLPLGPLLLRDWGAQRGRLTRMQHRQHKLELIRTLLATYPHLPFLLIGDSGQEDPEIYRQIVVEAPERVRAIYIRDVSRGRRDHEVEALRAEVGARGVEMLTMADTLAAAEYAAAQGLIAADQLAAIRADTAKDATPLPPRAELAIALKGQAGIAQRHP
ncbi:App1 family protein [Kallotenue papyrolyticum]|uniref:App1 family protein n=1 Tax=Kallotenue papyrolyticum TaxID=1325125 RepID=UPI000478530F|nr:phosphatase domain-containing protein [Kallotenue papyrolyticum]